jgi:hypothetical protein
MFERGDLSGYRYEVKGSAGRFKQADVEAWRARALWRFSRVWLFG